ncbi:MAG: flagellar basal body rod protein FlgC [Pseudomonadota bacterium]
MGISNIYQITGTALNAHSRHLDMIAQNMANSQVVSGTETGAYRAQRPVFAPLLAQGMIGENVGVQVQREIESGANIDKQHQPEHPLADEEGYIYLSNVNMVEEMTNMIQASRSYQSNVEVMNTSKDLMLRTLTLGN